MMEVDTYIKCNGRTAFFTRARTEDHRNVVSSSRYAFYEHDYDELDAKDENFEYSTPPKNPRAPHSIPPSKKDIKKVLELYEKVDKKTNKRVYSYNGISKLLGVSLYHVEKILKTKKKDPLNVPSSEENRKIVDLYNIRDKKTKKPVYSYNEISKLLGVSLYHVEKILKTKKKDQSC